MRYRRLQEAVIVLHFPDLTNVLIFKLESMTIRIPLTDTEESTMARQSERDYINQRIPKTFRLHPDRIAELDAMARDRYISQARVIEELIQDAARPTIDDRYRRLKEKEAASIEQAQP